MDAAEPDALPQDLVFVDLETTGANAAQHRVTEVGIVRIGNGELIDEWSSLVNPDVPIPAFIANFTGITDAMVAAAPRFADLAAEVLARLRPSRSTVFVAHNARFDYSFLRSEFRRLSIDFCAPVLCTVKLSRKLFPQFPRHSLDALMERHQLSCDARHRALGDARVLHEFWRTLRREVPEPRLAVAARAVLGSNQLPAYLPAGLADELPDGPGAYRFFGEDDALLYVDHAHSLRARILEHFSGEPAAHKGRRLAHAVRRIDWFETAGELGAQLRELAWSRRGMALFRKHKPSHAVTACLDGGASGVRFESLRDIAPAELATCFGVFQSRAAALKALTDIARAHSLCTRVLGLEPGEGSCIGFALGRCKGACIGKEPLLLHHMRCTLALSALKLRAWPFPGRVALREGRDELHVVERWQYLGTARGEDELAELRGVAAPVGFDVDVYRILNRYLAKHPNVKWHTLPVLDVS